MLHLILQIVASVILFFTLVISFFIIVGLSDDRREVIALSIVNLVLHTFIALLVWGVI